MHRWAVPTQGVEVPSHSPGTLITSFPSSPASNASSVITAAPIGAVSAGAGTNVQDSRDHDIGSLNWERFAHTQADSWQGDAADDFADATYPSMQTR